MVSKSFITTTDTNNYGTYCYAIDDLQGKEEVEEEEEEEEEDWEEKNLDRKKEKEAEKRIGVTIIFQLFLSLFQQDYL